MSTIWVSSTTFALVIALGSGMTAGCLARHAERVTVVELEPEVLGAAAAFAAWNHDALHDPRVRGVIDDGRHFLLTSGGARYDVITVDPPPPVETAGSSLLYSLEWYGLIKARLRPGGILQEWLPYGDLATLRARGGLVYSARLSRSNPGPRFFGLERDVLNPPTS